MDKFAYSWVFVWGVAYIAFSLTPNVYGFGSLIGFVGSISVGVAILLGLFLKKRKIGRIILLAMGIFETFGFMVNWTGVIAWDIPFNNQAFFQVNMATLDLISAVFLVYLSTISDRWRE